VDAHPNPHAASNLDCLPNPDTTSNIHTDIDINNDIHGYRYLYTQTFLNSSLYQNSYPDFDGFANEDSCSLAHSLSKPYIISYCDGFAFANIYSHSFLDFYGNLHAHTSSKYNPFADKNSHPHAHVDCDAHGAPQCHSVAVTNGYIYGDENTRSHTDPFHDEHGAPHRNTYYDSHADHHADTLADCNKYSDLISPSIAYSDVHCLCNTGTLANADETSNCDAHAHIDSHPIADANTESGL
jgi:hypothetical protein